MRKIDLVVVFLILVYPFTGFSQSFEEGILLHADSLAKENKEVSITFLKTIRQKYPQNTLLLYKSAQKLASLYSKLKVYDSAEYFLLEERKFSIQEKDSLDLYYVDCDLGWLYTYRKDFTSAIGYYQDAEHVFSNFHNDYSGSFKAQRNHAIVMNSIGSLYIKKLKYDSALLYLYKSLKLRKKIALPSKMLLANKFNIASCYIRMLDYEKSIIWLKELLSESISIPDSNFIAKSYNSLGVIYNNKNDRKKAVEMYQKAYLINKQSGNKNGVAHTANNIAVQYIDAGVFSKAKKYLDEAYSINQELGINNAHILLSYENLYFKQKNYSQTIESAREALKLAKKSGDTKIKEMSLEMLFQSYLMINQAPKALRYFQELDSLRESLSEQERSRLSEELKEKFETEKKKQEIAYLKQLNAKEKLALKLAKNRQNIILITAILLVLFLVFIVYTLIQKRKKSKQISKIRKALHKSEIKKSEMEKKELVLLLNAKKRELTSHTVSMIQKNHFLIKLSQQLSDLSKSRNEKQRSELQQLTQKIDAAKKSEKEWELFKHYFEDINADFYNKLKNINEHLNIYDYRIAALTVLNLNIKETATILNISPNSVKVARYRLKKRLHLEPEIDLQDYLKSLSSDIELLMMDKVELTNDSILID